MLSRDDMKKLYIVLIMLTSFSAFGSSKLKEADCVKYFSEAKISDTKSQLELYNKLEACNSFFEKNEALVLNVFSVYQKLFKVNRAHNHLEPFMPYYLKNKEKINKLVLQIENKEAREDFVERISLASREFLEGND